ncbi:hypothetical protein GCM10009737_00260 [Nocardioides lentus]|uniref:Uncharacterized protein n=2 Tax=Nocardioides lentus TaxID=338077 RepID=A0ABN2NWQ3_9ACTN
MEQHAEGSGPDPAPTPAEALADALVGLGLEPRTCPTGVVAPVAAASPGAGPAVLLRADPAGAHAAALLGAAAALAEAPPVRDVLLVWRTPGATRPDDRGTTGPLGPEEAFAVRLDPDRPAGEVHLRAGATTAHGEGFRVAYRAGRAPGGDALLAAGELVTRLRYSVAQLARDEPCAATVTAARVGEPADAGGLPPVEGLLHGVMRAHSEPQREALRTEVDRLARCTALAVGVDAEVTLTDGPAAVVSDPAYVTRLRSAIGDAARVVELDGPLLVADDLARLLDGRRGALAVVGTGGPAAPAGTLGPALVTAAALHLLAADGLPPA